MNIVGLITEYNPFHNGHLYHIQEAKRVTGADAAVVIMSGNFVQRGTPAIMPKHLRAKAALLYGADLVFELPVCFATGSAEFFAMGAVALLDSLGCIDSICFGSECGDSKTLGKIARILAEEPDDYKNVLQDALRKGVSFPQARQTALTQYFDMPSTDPDRISSVNAKTVAAILSQPNNILGIEYMKALYKRNSSMKAYSIKRIGAGYHESELTEGYSSASAIRRALIQDSLSESIYRQLPSAAQSIMKETFGTRYPVYANDFSLLLKYKLLQETKETLTKYMDISEDLANRIINLRNDFQSFDGFCDALKTKDMTYARISRGLLHILLDIRTEHLTYYKRNGYCHYAHILGFRKSSAELLSLLKGTSKVPLLTKLTQTEDLSEAGCQMLHQDIFASDLYESVITDKFGTPFINEYRQQIVKV